MRRGPDERTVLAVLGAWLLFLLVSAAPASALTLTASAPQTVSGQSFDFLFDPVPVSSGVDGVLTIHARGDYYPLDPNEFLTWDLDSLGIGGMAGPVIGGTTILLDNGINDVEWTQDFAILGSDLLAATADGALHILVDLNLNPDFTGVNHFADTEFVEASLSYESPIPEPSGALAFLVGCTVVQAGVARRRRAARSG